MNITRLPPKESLDTAIAWLRSNEGIDGEALRCAAVADWLECRETYEYARTEARKAGVPFGPVFRALRKSGWKGTR